MFPHTFTEEQRRTCIANGHNDKKGDVIAYSERVAVWRRRGPWLDFLTGCQLIVGASQLRRLEADLSLEHPPPKRYRCDVNAVVERIKVALPPQAGKDAKADTTSHTGDAGLGVGGTIHTQATA